MQVKEKSYKEVVKEMKEKVNDFVIENKKQILKVLDSEEIAETLHKRGWLVFYDEDELIDYVVSNFSLAERIKARL